jgi:chromosome segregation ATPase
MNKNINKTHYDNYKTTSDACACKHAEAKVPVEATSSNYGFYSKTLQKPFDTLKELIAAETAYLDEQKAKEYKAAKKKEDAQKVEEAFKALNAARKTYKEELAQITKEYAESLENLKKAFELGKKDITSKLTTAEDNYSKALKEFTDAHPEGYHLTLKDGDFETTISGSTTANKTATSPKASDIFDIFDLLFRI